MKTVNFMKNKNLLANLFPAVVKNIDDPAQMGRIKVSIPQLFGTGLSPWIYPFGYNCGVRLFHVPSIDKTVYVFFLNNDVESGFYGGGGYEKSSVASKIYDADYPNSYGFDDEAGNYFLANKASGDMVFHSYTGVNLEFSGKSCTLSGTILNLDFPVINVSGNLNIATGASGNVSAGQKILGISNGVVTNIGE